MRSRSHSNQEKDRKAWRRGWALGALFFAAFAWAVVRPAWSQQPQQDSGNEDAGDEEMLNGPNAGRRASPPQLRPGELPPPPKGVSFTTRLDKTAIYVGDQFHYTILVEYPADIEFVLDSLTKETVNMDPFQVMDVRTNVSQLKDSRNRLFFDVAMASYTTGQPTEQIPQYTLFYFRRGASSGGAAEQAAESLVIPGPVIGLRSTLPPNPQEIRDAVTVNAWDRSRWVVAGAGWLGLFVLVVGVGWETAVVLRRQKSKKGPDRRKAMDAVRDRWASSVPSDFSDAQVISDFYDRCHQDLKEYLGYYLETPTMGLTAEELNAEMERLGVAPDFAQKAVGVLGTLEAARYAQDGSPSARETAQRAAQDIREIFAASPRR